MDTLRQIRGSFNDFAVSAHSSRSVVSFPDLRSYRLTIHRTKLTAWSLAKWHVPGLSVRLPNGVHSFTAYQDRVGIVTSDFSILIWRIGGPLLPMEAAVDRLEDYLKAVTFQTASVFFHPHCEGTIL